MADCCLNFLRNMGSFVLGSLRMILFFGCLIYFILQAISLAILLFGRGPIAVEMPIVSGSALDVLLILAQLALTILGCYGAFYKHHPSIKAFAVLLSISTGISVLSVFLTLSPGNLATLNSRFEKRMQSLQPTYNWHSPADDSSPYYESTRAWDGLQSLACCGLKGPKDWDEFRPSNVSFNVYPRSCCPSYLLGRTDPCTTASNLFQPGCMTVVHTIESITLVSALLVICFNIFLCVVACIVGGINLDERPTNASGTNIHGISGHLPYQQVQRTDVMVYPRQPPVNPNSHDATKITEPPMYPNAHGVEKTGYTQPPPSYGTNP